MILIVSLRICGRVIIAIATHVVGSMSLVVGIVSTTHVVIIIVISAAATVESSPSSERLAASIIAMSSVIYGAWRVIAPTGGMGVELPIRVVAVHGDFSSFLN